MPAKLVAEASFSPDFLKFFREIKTHNDREWFNQNKERYERVVKEPCLAFIRAVGPELSRISPEIVADPRPVGGSMFRIYRDTRFSKDKSPYKTHAGLHFSHRRTSGDAHAPGFYLHLEPAASFACAGVWAPEKDALQTIREAIASRPKEWRKIRDSGIEFIEQDPLKRPPAGFDPSDPFIEDIKWRSFIGGEKVPDGTVGGPRLLPTFVAACRRMSPLNAFIAKAMGVPW